MSDPPPNNRMRPSRWRWFYDELRETPGEWREFPGYFSVAYKAAQRHPEYECTTRVVDGQQRAWMRYNP